MYQPFFEFWYKHPCPFCSAINWTYHSHSQRHEPICSPEICICHNCEKEYWLLDEQDVNDMYPLEEYDNDPVKRIEECGTLSEKGKSAPTGYVLKG